MKRTTNARVAGVTFLLYIIVGISTMFVARGATSGDTTAAKLASVAQHAPELRLDIVLGVFTIFNALALAVSLYGLTRDEDHELAVFALVCRVAEGVLGFMSIVATLALLSLATSTAATSDAAGAQALTGFLLTVKRLNPIVSGLLFAVGSTIFSYLFLRGRMIPKGLAWLGVVASLLLVVLLPAQLAGLVDGLITQLMWLPMAAFEIPLALWLLIKGVA